MLNALIFGWGRGGRGGGANLVDRGKLSGKSSYFGGWWLGEGHIINTKSHNFNFSAYKLKNINLIPRYSNGEGGGKSRR